MVGNRRPAGQNWPAIIYSSRPHLIFGDEFLAQGLHLKSHQRCSAAFCRPVKFFHTDWIIISLWFLSYAQRHCCVRIEKGSVQTVAIKLEAWKLMEMTKVVKAFIRRGWPNTFGNILYINPVISQFCTCSTQTNVTNQIWQSHIWRCIACATVHCT